MSVRIGDILYGKISHLFMSTEILIHCYRSHLNKYWTTCTDNGFNPTPPKDWTRPLGWVPPNEHGAADMGKGWVCQLNFLDVTDLWGNRGQLQQQSSTTPKWARNRPIPPVTKTGIKEHLVAIVATCDLVSSHPTYLWGLLRSGGTRSGTRY